MTKVTVHPGNCGFFITITAKKDKEKKIRISLDTECEMVKNMENDISGKDVKAFFKNHEHNPVYCSASKHIKHVSCPVMSGILKAVEVEAGLSVPEDVSIRFKRE